MKVGKSLNERYGAAKNDAAAPTVPELAMTLYLVGVAIMAARGLLDHEFVDTLLELQQWPLPPDLSERSNTQQVFAATLHHLIRTSGATDDTVRAAVRLVIAGTVMRTEPWPPSPEPSSDRIVPLLNRAAAVVYAQNGFNAPGGQS